MRICHARLGQTLAVVAVFFSVQISGQNTQAQTAPSPASPQTVCAFIVGQMTTLLPQQPTLCSGKQEKAPGYYSISIFSPKNVLEGDMRRAWSSSLFQTLEELVDDKSLNGACSVTPICFATISDAYMAQHNLRYRTVISKDKISLLRGAASHSSADEFSDHWYVGWWRDLFGSKESDSPGSKENATQLVKRACEDYLAELRKTHTSEFSKKQADHLAKEGGTLVGTVEQKPEDIKPPSCSVMLATDKSIYIALDFADLIDALNPANISELSPTFGRMFDTTGYVGQVVIRSPWTNDSDGPRRIYDMYPIQAISFAFEEKESRLRDDFDVEDLLSHFYVPGQMTQHAFLVDPKEHSVLRDAAVVKYAPGPDDTMLVDTTDGAEWKLSKESYDRCNLHTGDEIEVSTLLISGNTASTHGPPTLSTDKGGEYCKLTATFVKGL